MNALYPTKENHTLTIERTIFLINSNNTIFDDVFRTMLTKIPELIIPLVNEVFDTAYPPDISITRYQNELYDHHQKKITDSHFGIAHIHCKRLIFRYDKKIPDYFSVAGAP